MNLDGKWASVYNVIVVKIGNRKFEKACPKITLKIVLISKNVLGQKFLIEK